MIQRYFYIQNRKIYKIYYNKNVMVTEKSDIIQIKNKMLTFGCRNRT